MDFPELKSTATLDERTLHARWTQLYQQYVEAFARCGCVKADKEFHVIHAPAHFEGVSLPVSLLESYAILALATEVEENGARTLRTFDEFIDSMSGVLNGTDLVKED